MIGKALKFRWCSKCVNKLSIQNKTKEGKITLMVFFNLSKAQWNMSLWWCRDHQTTTGSSRAITHQSSQSAFRPDLASLRLLWCLIWSFPFVLVQMCTHVQYLNCWMLISLFWWFQIVIYGSQSIIMEDGSFSVAL